MRLYRLTAVLLIICALAMALPGTAGAFFVFTQEGEPAGDETQEVLPPDGEQQPEEDQPSEGTDALPSGGEEPPPALLTDEAMAPVMTPAPQTPSDGTFWTMLQGETNDAVIWDILMQPITVYDGGLDQRDHVYLMENPDGTGAKVAQVHAQSQGIQVLGEPNEHGYVLAQTYSSYDDEYFPAADVDKETAFGLKQGYVKAGGLKEVRVQTDYALLIDKLTQRLYIFRQGERVGELLVSTGLIQNGKTYCETPAGEFITVSHVGPFSTHKYMKSEMAIRISGGILVHEVPYEPLGDGSKRYRDFEAKLGTKASAGCIRVQRDESPEGYNQKWIWDNFKPGVPYKVIIWDDLNRTDTPTVWHEAGE